LSDAQLRVLEDIARDDFMPSLFARRRACTPAAVSRTLRQLQDAGLARSAIGETDGRLRAYSLTAEGRRTVERLRERRLAAVDVIWRDLPASELARFGKFSTELADRLDTYAERSARDV
jgi:DNA-binding MarR family transcriptional regulator